MDTLTITTGKYPISTQEAFHQNIMLKIKMMKKETKESVENTHADLSFKLKMIKTFKLQENLSELKDVI